MKVINISDLKDNLNDTLNSVIIFDEPITVCTDEGNVVILSKTEYNGLLETLYLNSQKGLVDKIKEGAAEDISEMAVYGKDIEF